MVFAREAGGHSSGNVAIPNGVTLVVLANLPPGQTRTLAAAGGLAVTTPAEPRRLEIQVLVCQTAMGDLSLG